MSNKRAGRIFFKIDGEIYDAKGSFTYNLGGETRTELVGHDSVHGFSSVPRAPMIEGEITDRGDLDVQAMQALEDVTVTLELNNGKTVALRNAWYASEGDIQTEEGNIAVKFVGLSAREIPA